MKNLQEHILKLAEECLHDASLFIVEVAVSNNPRNRKVSVLVEGDQGVGIDACANLSRELGERIETDNLIEEAYTLEVSSPGVDYPLDRPRLYQKNIGRTLKIQLKDGESAKGELIGANDTHIVLNEEVKAAKGKKVELKERTLFYEEIQKANVVVLFK